MSAHQLFIKNLYAGYVSSSSVLNDINLNINEGEIVSILGSNRAGKSILKGGEENIYSRI